MIVPPLVRQRAIRELRLRTSDLVTGAVIALVCDRAASDAEISAWPGFPAPAATQPFMLWHLDDVISWLRD